jgi:peptide/nickel transport system permease protein
MKDWIEEFYSFILFFFLLSLVVHSFIYLQERDQWAQLSIESKSLSESKFMQKTFWESYQIKLKDFLFSGGGDSILGGRSWEIILQKMGPTIILALSSSIFFSIFALFIPIYLLGIKADFTISIIEAICQFILSTPIFVVGILLVIVFFYQFQILPPGGFDGWNPLYWIMPSLALGSRIFSRLFHYVLSEAKSFIKTPLFDFYKQRGYSNDLIFNKYLRSQVFPSFFIMAILDFSALISGAMVVEDIFFYPGLGKLLLFSIRSYDFAVVQTILIVSGIQVYIIMRISTQLQKRWIGKKS